MGRLYLQIYHLYGAEDRHLLLHLHNVPGKPKLHSPMALERHGWTSLRGGGGKHRLKALGFELLRAVHHSSSIPRYVARTHNRLFVYTVVKSPVIGAPNASSVSKESTVWAWYVHVDKTFIPHARNDGTGYRGHHCAMGRLYLQIYHLYGAEDRHLLVHLHNVPRKTKLH